MHAECLKIRDDHLYLENVDVCNLAEEYGTPLYVTSESQLRTNFQRFQAAFPKADIYYAVKANNNLALLRILALEGAGADVFSAGELHLALEAGIPPDNILFNGNSKTDEELRLAVEQGVQVSADSIMEAEALSKIATEMDRTVEIAFRVNPDVSPDTHPRISTGLKTSKFGIPHERVVEAYKRADELDGIHPVGIHCHIGSQILDVGAYTEATEKMMKLAEQIGNLGIKLKFVDLGGGLGIPYHPDDKRTAPKELADAILPTFKDMSGSENIKLILEPGRYIVGNTTILLARVNTVKKAASNFVGIDAGFNLLVRPVMYDAYHHVMAANKADQKPEETYTIAGPICETGDIIAKDRLLPRIDKNDLIAVLDTGAYGYSMSSQYNGRPRCAEILVSGDQAEIIRRAESMDDLLRTQVVP